MKKFIVYAMLLYPLIGSNYNPYKDWRFNDLKKMKVQVKSFQVDCYGGSLYYFQSKYHLAIPVLDFQENFVKCK